MGQAGSLPDVIQGVSEPESSRIVLSILGIGLLGLMGMFTVIFSWDAFPVLSDLVPLFDNLGGSGIWYYLVGILVGFTLLIASVFGEVTKD